MSKNVKLTFTKTDSFLDITYYQVKTEYWDGEEVIKDNCSSFTFGDVLLPILRNIDSMNTVSTVSVCIKNNETDKERMKHLTDQSSSKSPKFKTRQELTSSLREADYLKEVIRYYKMEVLDN